MKKIISIVLATVMLISILPAMAVVAEGQFDAVVDVSPHNHNEGGDCCGDILTGGDVWELDYFAKLIDDLDILRLNVVDNKIYYLTPQGIYYYDTDSLQITEVIKKDNIFDFYFRGTDDIVYFIKNDYLSNKCDAVALDLTSLKEDILVKDILIDKIDSISLFSDVSLFAVVNPRLTIPANNNQYYIKSGYSYSGVAGVNACILGTSGKQPTSGSVLPNCVGYAWGRAYEILGSKPKLSTGNAGGWYKYNINNGFYKYGQKPALGAIAVWDNWDNNTGHVAVVEKIEGDYVTTSESAWNGTLFFTTKRNIKSSNFGSSSKRFLGFIYANGGGGDEQPQASPSISSTSYVGGKTVTITGQSGSTLRYTRNGGTLQSTSSNSTSFNITSDETIAAYSPARTGFIQSPTNTQKISVTKLAAPTITTTFEATGVRVTMSAASGATIYYTTDGSMPGTGSTKYTAPFIRTTNANIVAMAAQSGCANSSSSPVKNITVAVPKAPTPSLFETAAKVAVGDPIKVKWDKVDEASSYQATLYKDGSVISTQTTTETLASFVLKDAGQYQVKVKAINFVGSGVESTAVNAEAMNPCKVTFKSWDDTVIEEFFVKYNTTPTYPKSHPSREGHSPNGWSVAPNTKIDKDTVITALYNIEIYDVTFYDVNGTTRMGEVQRIPYNQAATPPTNYTIATGYKFAGWHITRDSDGTSYEKVNGNIKLVATQTWANPNLTVVTTIDSARRQNDGKTHTITVSYTNSDVGFNGGRIVTVLKTADGKMIASDTSDITKADGTPGVKKTKTIEIIHYGDERASKAEVVVVGFNGSNTGGALSDIATATIIIGDEWGAWSDWSTTAVTANADRQVETKTQHRARSYEYTTSTAATLSGWESDTSKSPNPSIAYGTWTAWSKTKPAAATNRDIETSPLRPATYKTQYNYWGYKDASNRYHFCAGAGKYVYGTTFSRIESGWRDTTLVSASMNQTCGGGLSGCWHTGRFNATVRYGSVPYYYGYTTRQVEVTAAYYEYRYRDNTPTYYYRRWKAWSDWSDTAVAGDAKETRTMYRYRDKVPVYDPTPGTNNPVQTVSGNLKGITENFAGRKATVLVYQGKNNDPTATFLQYVGQTTIGANNSYNFSFNPKGEPTEDTGDFVVTLALEGATRIVTVDVIKAPKPKYEVRFLSEGQLVEARTVEEGNIAVPPAVPPRTGHTFVGWNDVTTNISSERTLTAQWQKNEYVAVLVDFANNTVEMQPYTYGDTIGLLKTPQYEGKIFKGWYTMVGEEKQPIASTDTITGNTIVIADWESVKYTVTFVDKDNKAVSTQQVAHGTAAAPPAPLTSTEMIFAGWSTDVEWWKVTGDMTVMPIFLFDKTAEAPMVNSDMNDTGGFTEVVNIVTLTSTTTNATIYYSIEGSVANQVSLFSEESVLPAGFDAVYFPDTPIVITGDVRITMMSVAEGMNASEVVVIDVPFDNSLLNNSHELIQFRLEAEGGRTQANGYVDMPIYISTTVGIADLQLGLSYNRDVLTLVSSTPGNAFQVVENGLLTTLRFKVAANASPGDYSVVITPNAKNAAGGNVQGDGTEDFITVLLGDNIEPGLYVNGTKTSKLAVGNVMIVKQVPLTTVSATAILAVYTSNGKLVRMITSDNITLNTNGTKTMVASTTLTQTEFDTGCYIKFLVWDSLSTMQPIGTVDTYRK